MKVINGNNIDLLKQYPDNYFDAVVTDPPYGLGKEPVAEEVMKDWVEKGYHEITGSGFMGKEWDAFVPQPVFWKEVFRVLKYGGHILSFYGSRTYDWGVMSMRFAGFEVKDTLTWHYGNGFPKSHNISKFIDKMGGESLDWFIDYILEVAKEKGISKKELTMLFPSKNGNPTGWLWNKQNNQSITIEQYNKIKDYLKLPFENISEAKREVIGKKKAGLTKGQIANFKGEVEFDITAPSTDAAKKWDGWGTALKPASEYIVLARKPLEKGLSIAENVLKWGTGGINIDGCRIGLSKGDDARLGGNGSWKTDKAAKNVYEGGYNGEEIISSTLGRFPANLILSHSPMCKLNGLKKVKGMIDKPTNRTKFDGTWNEGNTGLRNNTNSSREGYADINGNETIEDWTCHENCPIRIMDEQSGDTSSKRINNKNNVIKKGGKNKLFGSSVQRETTEGFDYRDSGGASRFFYCAKASKSERNKGLEGFEEKESGGMSGTKDKSMLTGSGNERNNLNKNFHPTVKPVKLMQYLARLITPPNGIVLDPFCGSGTTGIACKLEGFEFVGMEQDAEYCKIAEARINNYQEEPEEPLEFIEEEDKPRVIQQTLF